MTLWKLAGSTAAAALFAGQAAFAVTPEEVLQAWKDASTSYGQTVTTASEAREGDVLVVTGLSMASTTDAASKVEIPEMRLADQGDGTVEVTMSDAYQVQMQAKPADASAAPQAVVLDIAQPGLTVIASGEVGAMDYTFDVPTLSVTLNSLDGKPAAEAGAAVKVDITGMAGTYAVDGTGNRTIANEATVASIAFDIASTDATAGTSGTFKGTVKDVATKTDTTMGTAVDLSDMAAALKAGFTTVAGFTYGQSDFTFDMTDASGKTAGKGSFADGSFDVAMDAAQLAYGGSANGLSLSVSGPSIPVPEVTLGYKESAFNFVMPVAKSDTPADFSLLTRIVDLTMADDVWALFDPEAQLPRDPITLIVDAAGKAKLTTDLMDDAAVEAAGDVPPGEIHALDLKQVQLRAIGAEVNAKGSLTFDNSGATTFNGMPAPTGTINIDASGVNGVLDKLTAMGLLPEDQVAGARMMLGMFAKPGEGADTLTSVLEFKDGGFFANGMQLQ